MKTLRKSIICLFLAICTANAQPESFEYYSTDNTRTSVYLHPVSLLIGTNEKTLILYSTVEIPLSLYNAPIIKPGVWHNKDLLALGAELGFRHYPSGRGEGLYLQPQVGAFYLSAKDFSPFSMDFEYEDDKQNKRKGAWLEFMGFLGSTHKFRYLSIYYDTGIGYSCIFSKCSLLLDGNMGIGIPF